MSVASCAAVAALAAFLLTPFMRSCAISDAKILGQWVHVVVAGVFGALAGLAPSWPEQLTFTVLAVAAALLTVIDFAEERLPDRIVYPLMIATPLLLTLAAAVQGQWGSLLRAVITGVGLTIVYFVMFCFARDLGFGDVKLAFVIGAVGGWFSISAVLLGFAIGWGSFAVVAIIMLLTGRRKRKTSLPFGPFMILGAVLGIFGAPLILG